MIPHEEILHAYSQGYFPMAHSEENDEIYWHLPDKRGIVPLDERFIINKNLRRLYNQKKFELKQDCAFDEVIRCCADREETWISEEIIETYCNLYKQGIAHSFEAWYNGKLVGGLYGISIKKAFFGESMFSKMTNSSKITLIFLVETLRSNGFKLLDSQYLNNHIKQFGAYEINHDEYLELLNEALHGV